MKMSEGPEFVTAVFFQMSCLKNNFLIFESATRFQYCFAMAVLGLTVLQGR